MSTFSPSIFALPVTAYTTTQDLKVAQLDTPVAEVVQMLGERRISGVPVVDANGGLAGVISRMDLIVLGAMQAGQRPTNKAMPLPGRTAAEVMRPMPHVVGVNATVREAATVLVTHQVHRVFVVEDGVLVGVCTSIDLARAVRDSKADVELSTVMSTPIVTIEPQMQLSAAIDLLERLRVVALIVTEDGLPIGSFSQAEALASRDLPRDTPIEALYDPAVICLPTQTRLHRAADHLTQLDVRRVVACKSRDAIGIATALDLARYITLV